MFLVPSSPSRQLELRAPSLTVRLDPVDGSLRVVGVLDRRTVSAFHAAVTELLGDPRRSWVIDVQGLVSCDVVGLRALGIAYRRTLVRGRRLVVIGAAPWLCRALHRIRLDDHLLAPRSEQPVGTLLEVQEEALARKAATEADQ